MKKILFLFAGFLLVGCGDTFPVHNQTDQEVTVNGETFAPGQCKEWSEDQFENAIQAKTGEGDDAVDLGASYTGAPAALKITVAGVEKHEEAPKNKDGEAVCPAPGGGVAPADAPGGGDAPADAPGGGGADVNPGGGGERPSTGPVVYVCKCHGKEGGWIDNPYVLEVTVNNPATQPAHQIARQNSSCNEGTDSGFVACDPK